jgi:cell wall-associated NlpC family hydrolase
MILLAATAPVRAEPSHRAERVTEWLCGEIIAVLEHTPDWVRGRGPDGYEGWVTASAARGCAAGEVDAWRREATLWSLGTELLGGSPRPANRLPWGARARPVTAGRVALPDGTIVVPRDPDRLVHEEHRAELFPATGEAIVETAMQWLGAPYMWGGRTRAGVDCSGLVQAVYGLHGLHLPRDSGPQRGVGPDLATGPEAMGALEPGDLLFFAPEGKGISHVAISTGGAGVLHAAVSNGRVDVDDLASDRDLARLLRRSIVASTRPLAGDRLTSTDPNPPR